MKKINIFIIVLLFFVMLVFTADVFAITANFPAGSGSFSKITTPAKIVWGTVTLIVQILAFTAIIFAGLRYMFAGADQKADIKKGLGILALGAVLVFATATFVKFVTGSIGQIIS